MTKYFKKISHSAGDSIYIKKYFCVVKNI